VDPVARPQFAAALALHPSEGVRRITLRFHPATGSQLGYEGVWREVLLDLNAAVSPREEATTTGVLGQQHVAVRLGAKSHPSDHAFAVNELSNRTIQPSDRFLPGV